MRMPSALRMRELGPVVDHAREVLIVGDRVSIECTVISLGNYACQENLTVQTVVPMWGTGAVKYFVLNGRQVKKLRPASVPAEGFDPIQLGC